MANEKNIILVDCFDTVIFRQVHSFQIMPQWARKMNIKYPQVTEAEWLTSRKAAIKELGGDECAIRYCDLIEKILSLLPISLPSDIYGNSLEIDTEVDLATQYPNREMLRRLSRYKANGKKIYLVTDYYLPQSSIRQYLTGASIADIFDGVYVSSDYKKTKKNGLLYQVVFDELGIKAEECIMIGDSKHSDCKMAAKNGIAAKRYFPIAHKLKTNYRRITNTNFTEIGAQKIWKSAKSDSYFTEYALNLFYFTKELHRLLLRDKAPEVCFLSRGGVFP